MLKQPPMWKVPLFDTDLGDAECAAAEDAIRSGWLTMGDRVRAFEESFAAFIGVRHAVAVSSCTAALHIANRALGIGPGDEVICPSLTFVASPNTIMLAGARPVFADIAAFDDFGLSPEDVERRVTPRTRAIHVLHYAGAPCGMDGIMAVAGRHGLRVIEDCAHAPGASHEGRPVGTIGDFGCFSFFSNKNMTTGEGGMLTTGDEALAEKARLMRSHGMTTLTLDRHLGRAHSYDVIEEGFNYRFDEMRAAIGLAQLDKLPEANRRRRDIFRLYRQRLAAVPGLAVAYPEDDTGCVHHILPVLLPGGVGRDLFMDAMKARGVQTSIHYPPSHLFDFYRRNFGHGEGDLPVTEAAMEREITLPLYPAMTEEDVDYVCGAAEACLP